MTKRAAKIEMRVTPAFKKQVKFAAAMEKQSVTDCMVEAAERRLALALNGGEAVYRQYRPYPEET